MVFYELRRDFWVCKRDFSWVTERGFFGLSMRRKKCSYLVIDICLDAKKLFNKIKIKELLGFSTAIVRVVLMELKKQEGDSAKTKTKTKTKKRKEGEKSRHVCGVTVV